MPTVWSQCTRRTGTSCGICWEGNCYVDMALPFGLRSAPLIFTAVADAIGWALLQSGVELFIHYLDDFLFFSPPAPRPVNTLQMVLNTLRHLGVPVAHEKIEGPAPVVTFLGIVTQLKHRCQNNTWVFSMKVLC